MALAVVLLPLDASAQSWPPTEIGQDIRLWAPSLGMVKERASVISWHAESLSMIQPSVTDSVDVPLDAIVRLEVLEGKSRWRGALLVGSIASVAGFAIGLAGRDCEAWDDLCQGGLGVCWYGGRGGLVGFLAGGLVGSQIPMDVWRRQELPDPSGAGR